MSYRVNRRLTLTLLSLFVILAWRPCAACGQIPAFPGAEGFGAISVGGRGGDVYHVTSLADTNTLGTLRHAISSAPSAGRTVVFDISGNIHLNSDLSVNKPRITIAGQTAPGQGITLTGDSVWLQSNDLVVRYIRSRLTSTGGTQDALSIQNGNRVILDHSSASWSADEVTSMTRNSSDNTIQWSLITEALNVQNHSRSSLFRPGADAGAPFSYNLSVHHSLYAHGSDRNPVFSTYNEKTLNVDFRNNVVFDWRNQASHTGGSDAYVNLNFVGNYYVAGLTTRSDLVANPKIYSADGPRTTIYHDDNKVDATRDDGLHNGVYLASSVGGGFTNALAPFDYPAVTTESADDAYHSVLNYGGSFWWNRDPVDHRVITDVYEISEPDPNVRAQSGTMLTTEADAGGLPVLPIESRAANWDTDLDGMPDHWEIKHGLNPNLSTDRNDDFDADGYTNLEEYLNEIGAWPAPQAIRWQGGNGRFALTQNWDVWQPSRFDVVDLPSGTATVDAIGQHAGTIRIGTQAGTPATLQITAGWLEVADEILIGAGISKGHLVLTGGRLNVPTMSLDVFSDFKFTGGTLSAETVGFDLVNDGGTIAPGTSVHGPSIGMTHVMGDLTFNSGVLEIEVGGNSLGDADFLLVDGVTMLGGTLRVLPIDLGEGPYVPQLGDQVPVVASQLGTGGMFDEFELPSLAPGLEWAWMVGAVTNYLQVVEADPLAGDYNNDGQVDAADYTIWRDSLASGTPLLNETASPGTVDQEDYDAWKANFGATVTAGAGAVAQVPEPAAGALAFVSALVLCQWRRKGDVRRCNLE